MTSTSPMTSAASALDDTPPFDPPYGPAGAGIADGMRKAKAAAMRAARAGAAGGMEPIGRLHDGHAHEVAIALADEWDRHDAVTPSAAPNALGYDRDDAHRTDEMNQSVLSVISDQFPMNLLRTINPGTKE